MSCGLDALNTVLEYYELENITREEMDAVNITVADDERALIPMVVNNQRDTTLDPQGNYNVEVILSMLQQQGLQFETWDWKKI